MEFGWINAAGGGIVALMLAPNVLYALKRPAGENRCDSRVMNALEQAGRYGSMALMVFPVGVWRFGFPGVGAMLGYLVGNGVLLAAYWGCWAAYWRRESRVLAAALAALPTGIFVLSGLTLGHWLLVLAGGIFGVGHMYVTLKNDEKKARG